MRGSETAKLIGGSIAVYAIMAACSGTGGPDLSGSNGGRLAVGTAANDSGSNATLLTNPVPAANAQPTGASSFTEACNKTSPNPDAGPFVLYAEHAFPGYTAQQLASVVALGSGPGNFNAIPGYPLQTVGTSVRDGYVAAACGYGVGTSLQEGQYQSVTFVLPP
jgi:hypothetical protein